MDYEKLYFELLETANKLRSMVNTFPEPPAEITDNINAAITYLDCAKENSGQLSLDKKARFVVRQQIMLKVP